MPTLQYIFRDYDFGTPDEITELGQARIRDTIRFSCGGRDWRLRRLYRAGNAFVSLELAARLLGAATIADLGATSYAALETEAEVAQADELDGVVSDLCWLLQMARGARVNWNELRLADDEKMQALRVRYGFRRWPFDGGSPIKNGGDGSLKVFLERAWPVYQEAPDWWRITIDWFSLAYSISTIEVSGLVCLMLLERITGFVLKATNPPRQIDDALDDVVSTDGTKMDAFTEELNTLMLKYSPKWPKEQTESLVKTIDNWNRTQSYKNQIRAAFEKYHLEPPPSRVLENRHTLAHGGELSSRTKEPGQYFTEICSHVIRLILSMLNYSGPYFVIGGERVMLSSLEGTQSEAPPLCDFRKGPEHPDRGGAAPGRVL